MKKKDHYEQTRDYFKISALERDGYYDAKSVGPPKHSFWQRRVRKIVRHFLDILLVGGDSNILTVMDVGCGRGDFTKEIAKCYPRLIGVSGCDFSKETLSVAKKNSESIQGITFQKADLLKMPFEDNAYDLTLCVNVLHHIEKKDLGKALSELARITKSNLIVEIKNNDNFYYRQTQKSHDDINVFPSNIDEIGNKLGRHGFRLKKKRGILIFDYLSPMIVLMYNR